MFQIVLLTVATAALLSAQAMAEMGAAAAGGLAGATAGKAVSGGITAAMQKLDEAAKQGAEDGKAKEKGKETAKKAAAPVVQVSPTTSSASLSRGYSVPEPPPSRNAPLAPKRRAAATVHDTIPVTQAQAELPPTPTAPVIPAVTLASIEPGMEREMVARISSPAIRITSFEEGHLVELYRYKEGVIKLLDGSVQTVTRR